MCFRFKLLKLSCNNREYDQWCRHGGERVGVGLGRREGFGGRGQGVKGICRGIRGSLIKIWPGLDMVRSMQV